MNKLSKPMKFLPIWTTMNDFNAGFICNIKSM